MSELWDAYDVYMNKIPDMVLDRSEKRMMPEGIYHLGCNVIVRSKDGEYLLMQRDPRKNGGLLWEATAGGAAILGETPEKCARRELFEETGILSDNLKEVGRVIEPLNHAYHVEYLCEVDKDAVSIVFQEGETVAYKWVTADELLRMSSKELITYRMQTLIPELKYRRREIC